MDMAKTGSCVGLFLSVITVGILFTVQQLEYYPFTFDYNSAFLTMAIFLGLPALGILLGNLCSTWRSKSRPILGVEVGME